MPLYFAYGANMDKAAMKRRCPASRPLGPARLMNHRFFIMSEGYASVRRAPGQVVHGLLWDLALSDVASLDAFEDVASGLYTKIVQPVLRAGGSSRALVYLGRASQEGLPRPGYLDAVIAAAAALDLPPAYLAGLAALLKGGTRGGAFAQGDDPARQGPVPGVRARFATPFDRP